MPQQSRPQRRRPSVSSDPILDEVNIQLLAQLHTDPRMSMSALARRLGMSSPAVTERVRRLEESGVIVGYQMNVDPAALGLPVAAFVRVRPTAGQLSRVADLADRIPQVSECHRITGEDCLLLKVHARDVEQLETILDQFLLHGQTTTSIVVATPVPPRPLRLPGT
jgi:Lrp/AsnC family transcriptional regulator, leucine-responsive regulatory protein